MNILTPYDLSTFLRYLGQDNPPRIDTESKNILITKLFRNIELFARALTNTTVVGKEIASEHPLSPNAQRLLILSARKLYAKSTLNCLDLALRSTSQREMESHLMTLATFNTKDILTIQQTFPLIEETGCFPKEANLTQLKESIQTAIDWQFKELHLILKTWVEENRSEPDRKIWKHLVTGIFLGDSLPESLLLPSLNISSLPDIFQRPEYRQLKTLRLHLNPSLKLSDINIPLSITSLHIHHCFHPIDVSKLTNLKELVISASTALSLDLTHNPLLTKLEITDTPLVSLHIPSYDCLEVLNLISCGLTSLPEVINSSLPIPPKLSLLCLDGNPALLDTYHNDENWLSFLHKRKHLIQKIPLLPDPERCALYHLPLLALQRFTSSSPMDTL